MGTPGHVGEVVRMPETEREAAMLNLVADYFEGVGSACLEVHVPLEK